MHVAKERKEKRIVNIHVLIINDYCCLVITAHGSLDLKQEIQIKIAV
jgi:hypothetical protein